MANAHCMLDTNTNFHENPSGGSRVIPFGRTDRDEQTDMTKLITRTHLQVYGMTGIISLCELLLRNGCLSVPVVTAAQSTEVKLAPCSVPLENKSRNAYLVAQISTVAIQVCPRIP
jgi:hypothetical protein